MALALYRRFRPKQFKDVIDQTDIAAALKNQVAAGKVSHAYLFTGIRGTGKTTLARILAKAVNCKNAVEGEPCGVCDICIGIDNGSILDVTEIDAASNNGVDNIRDLRDETAYTPAVAEKRVYIIDEVHMLSAGAFNALLKIMEEPPEHVMFILATTEIHKIPATILSRCQRFDLRRISTQAIAAYLLGVAKGEGWVLQPEAAAAIARLSDGAMRDALSILDTCASLGEVIDQAMVKRFSGDPEEDYLFLLADSIADGDIASAMRQIGEIYENSVNPATLAGKLLRHFRNLLMVAVGGECMLADSPKEEVARYAVQFRRFSKEEMISTLQLLKELASSLPVAADKRLQLELCFIELCGRRAGADKKPPPGVAEQLPAVREEKDRKPRSEEREQPSPLTDENIPPFDVRDGAKETEKTGVSQPMNRPAASEDEIPEELDGQIGFLREAPSAVMAKQTPETVGEPEEDIPPWDMDAVPLGESAANALKLREETKGVPAAETEKQREEIKAPSSAERQDGEFVEWPQVVEMMKKKNGMLYGFMLGSSAYRTPTHILIDCSESFKEQLRERKEYAEAIKEAIAETTGLRMPIGPYVRKEEEETVPTEDDPLEQLIQLARENDIPVDVK